MLDYARHETAMYGPLAATDPAPLDRFQVFKQNWPTSYTYDYYSTPAYDSYLEPEIDSSTSVYHNLVSRDYLPYDEWKTRMINDWNEDDTMSWYVDTIRSLEISEYDWPPSKFRIPGIALRGMTRDHIIDRMSNPRFDHSVTVKFAGKVYERLQHLLCGYLDNNSYQCQDQETMLDLDSFDNRQKPLTYDYHQEQFPQTATDSSSNDAEDYYRNESPSPDYYGSDGSKSGDDVKSKRTMKRPPGRPKGSGRKNISKRPRSMSVPEFLNSLLRNSEYCPAFIKWEDYSKGLFRFVKPDEVAKLWGTMKQNENMTFEKFSRAMRYHYRNGVLVSVPTQRLVYQFGPKGPNYKTDNPNFVNPI